MRPSRHLWALALLALPALSFAQGRVNPGGGDSVGSLPGTAGGSQPSPTTHATPSPNDELGSRLVLAGTPQELARIVADVSGPGTWIVEPISGKGLARMTFTGRVSVVLDRQLLATSFADAQLEIGPAFAGGVAVIRIDDDVRAAQALRVGSMSLHLQRAVRTGLIDRGVSFTLLGRLEGRSAITLQGSGNLLRIEQYP